MDLTVVHTVQAVVSLMGVVPVDQVVDMGDDALVVDTVQHHVDLFLPDQEAHVLNVVDNEVEVVHCVHVASREHVPFPVTESMNDPFDCRAFVSFSRDEYSHHHHRQMMMYLDLMMHWEVVSYSHCCDYSD